MKDHEIAQLVNALRDCAVEFHDAQQLRERIAALIVPALRGVRSPAPVAEIREPTPEECERILSHFASPANCTAAKTGRAMFDAVRAVMWPKGGES